jgi:hypothetical protein
MIFLTRGAARIGAHHDRDDRSRERSHSHH